MRCRHALVRFLERQHRIDMPIIKEQMLASGVREAILLGAKRVKSDGIDFRVQDGIVVTVI